MSVQCFNSLPHNPDFKRPQRRPWKTLEEKGENAGNQHFLIFPQCFLLYPREKLSLYPFLICRLQMLSIWLCPTFCRLEKG